MRFLHLADLHLGKRLNEYDLYEEQRHFLDEIVSLCGQKDPDAVLIAGDVYDKPIPNLEAIRLFDDFLAALCARNIPVLLISGNHDSGERLGFASGLLQHNGVYISGSFDGELQSVAFNDEYGTVRVWLLPFVRPANVRAALAAKGLPTDGITDYTSAIRAALAQCTLDPNERHILVAHQFVTARGGDAPERSDSEALTSGGLDDVDVSVFEPFDYVALGHLHGPQRIGCDCVRYAGTPFPYSVSEQHHHKSACFVTLGAKGDCTVELLPLHSLRGVRAVEGTLGKLCAEDFSSREPSGDYVMVRLIDDGPMDDPIIRLRKVFPRLLGVELIRRGEGAAVFDPAELREAQQDPMKILAEFFESQLGRPMTEYQAELARKAFQSAEEGLL